MNRENIRYLAYTVCALVGVLIVGFLFFKYVFSALLPFLLGWAIAFIARPPAAFVSRHTRLPIGVARLIITLFGTALAFGLLGLAVFRISGELWRFLSGLTENGSLSEYFTVIFGEDGILGLGGELGERVGEAIYEVILSFLKSLGSALSGFAAKVPGAILSVLVTLIAAVYFSLDLERVNLALLSILPTKWRELLSVFKDRVFRIGFKYVKSYLLLMLITFSVLLLGFVILGVPYALLLSIVTAILDVLPILGIGAVLVPYSIFSFATGNSALGFGLIILYGVGSVIRQLLEPKIVGKNLGVHPLLSLLMLYVGYTVFGIGGLILVPLLVALVTVVFNKDDAAKIGKDTH